MSSLTLCAIEFVLSNSLTSLSFQRGLSWQKAMHCLKHTFIQNLMSHVEAALSPILITTLRRTALPQLYHDGAFQRLLPPSTPVLVWTAPLQVRHGTASATAAVARHIMLSKTLRTCGRSYVHGPGNQILEHFSATLFALMVCFLLRWIVCCFQARREKKRGLCLECSFHFHQVLVSMNAYSAPTV